MSGSARTEVSGGRSLVCCMMLCPPVEKLVASIGKQQCFSAAVSTVRLTSKRTLQFCCKVTDRSDASNYVLSPTVEVKVETGEGRQDMVTPPITAVLVQHGSLRNPVIYVL